MNKVECYFDGAVSPVNPGGHAGFGVIVFKGDVTLFSQSVYMGRWPDVSNNCAEYCGAIGVMRYLLTMGIETATVKGDADLIIHQLNGKWRAKRGAYLPYHQEAWALRQKLPNVTFEWIPREMNMRADELSKEAVSRTPRVVGFQLDSTIEQAAPPIIKKRQRTRDARNQLVLAPDLDDEGIIAEFRSMYG